MATKKRTVSKTVKKATVRKTPVKKTVRKTVKKNPVRSLTRYAVKVSTGNAHGYLRSWEKTGPIFDTDPAYAMQLTSKAMADHFKNAIFTSKPKGIVSVDSVILGSPSKKK